MGKTKVALILAVLAAVFYAASAPFSKVLMENIPPTMMAAFLYLGAGCGVGIMYAVHWKKEAPSERLSKRDLPYTIAMIVLDILAPIFLMVGIAQGNASNASLLGNFEIVATTVIALVVFREPVSGKLWIAIIFIVVASIMLSWESQASLDLSFGSIFVILATICWGIENNCTRKISDKSTYEIVVLKGVFSGGGALMIALAIGERFFDPVLIAIAMALGFVSYGLSIFFYIRAQAVLGAAKTSAYYAIAPFVGVILAALFLGERFTILFAVAFLVMAIGAAFTVMDTFDRGHAHEHCHTVVHRHDGKIHAHALVHSHPHRHAIGIRPHLHRHPQSTFDEELERLHAS